MSWISLICAGLFEMLGVLSINRLNHHKSIMNFVFLVLSFGLSFLLLAYAMESIPMGTAYAIWTGIGASGGAILGMILYNEGRSVGRIVSIAIIISAVVGLKLVG